MTGMANFYPRPPRGGRPWPSGSRSSSSAYFYPRPPRGGRPVKFGGTSYFDGFLPTPSARRATRSSTRAWHSMADFYPRPPRGGRHDVLWAEIAKWMISTHALREEGDTLRPPRWPKRADFYPRPPRGGRRRPLWSRTGPCGHFYPRPPRGGRPRLLPVMPRPSKFLPTPSARRATRHCRAGSHWADNFYPRPPRGGRLHSQRRAAFSSRYFYPRPPRGGRPAQLLHHAAGLGISTHALREEGDKARKADVYLADISTHALREEGDTPISLIRTGVYNFYPRPPRGGRPICQVIT